MSVYEVFSCVSAFFCPSPSTTIYLSSASQTSAHGASWPEDLEPVRRLAYYVRKTHIFEGFGGIGEAALPLHQGLE